MIDTVQALAVARKKAYRTAEAAYPEHRMEGRRMVFERTVVREFADMCLPGGYASLIGYTGNPGGQSK